jgi:hypothetical protein
MCELKWLVKWKLADMKMMILAFHKEADSNNHQHEGKTVVAPSCWGPPASPIIRPPSPLFRSGRLKNEISRAVFDEHRETLQGQYLSKTLRLAAATSGRNGVLSAPFLVTTE